MIFENALIQSLFFIFDPLKKYPITYPAVITLPGMFLSYRLQNTKLHFP